MGQPSRRRVLGVAGSALAVAVAGCGSRDDATTGGETRGTSATSAATTKSSATTRATTGADPTEETTDDGEPTEETTEEAVSDAERVAIAKRVVDELAAEEYASVQERFDESVADQVSASQLSQAWATYAEPLGAYRGATVADTGETNGGHYVTLRATFERGLLRIAIAFDGTALTGLRVRPVDQSYDPPAYADASAFSERELTLASAACDLEATLTLPEGATDDDPVTGVVLVHGSGPADRNSSVGPNRPFQDLAWGLASRGVAALRYEKRTFACDVSRRDGLGLDALTVDDAVLAIDRLREQAAVDDVAVVGHSLGGMAAPRIAERASTDRMAVLAGPAGSLPELVEHQIRYLANLDDAVTDAERDRIERVETAVERIERGDLGEDEVVLGYHAAFWRDVAAYDQTAVAAALSQPRFLAFAGRDYQVPADRARPAWTTALEDASNATFETYTDANHLFVPGSGPPTPGEYRQSGHVTADLVADLAAWASDD